MNDIDSNNTTEIIELNSGEEETLTPEDDNIETLDEPKPKKEFFWHKLTKKQKIIIIAIIAVVLIGIIVFVLVKGKKKEPVKPSVIIQEENYRYEDGKLIFLDQSKKEIGSYECTKRNQDECYVAYYNIEEDLDVDRYLTEEEKPFLKRSKIYDSNFVFVIDGSEVVNLYNINTKSIDGKYDSIKEYKDNYIIVNKDDKYSVLEFKEGKANTVLSEDYSFIGYLGVDDSLIVKDKNGYGIIDVDKTIRVGRITDAIKFYGKKYIVTDKYKLLDFSGKSIETPAADFITLKDNYVLLVKSSKLFVFDEGLKPINVEGIELSSSDYLKTIIVKEDGTIEETKEAFSFTASESNINIKVDENEYNFNPVESIINNSLEYINYIDGTLYFYKEKDKKTQIGKYTCNNQNHVSNSDEVYDECFIAKETKLINRNYENEAGYLPIYNERYVFIADQSSVSDNKNIVFYDLKQNKVLSNYLEVDAGFYNTEKTVNVATATDVIAIAHKPNSSYIAFLLNSKGVQPIVRNENNASSISFLKDNILAKYENGTYHLFKTTGEEITKNISDLKSEIVEYRDHYIVVKNADKYQIYNVDTGKVVSDEFVYIALYGTYYVAINSSKELNIYNYISKDKLLCQNILIDGAGEYKDSYYIRYVSSTNVTVTVNTSPKREYVFNGSDEFVLDGTTISCGGE
jgi:hypothetical protein